MVCRFCGRRSVGRRPATGTYPDYRTVPRVGKAVGRVTGRAVLLVSRSQQPLDHLAVDVREAVWERNALCT